MLQIYKIYFFISFSTAKTAVISSSLQVNLLTLHLTTIMFITIYNYLVSNHLSC